MADETQFFQHNQYKLMAVDQQFKKKVTEAFNTWLDESDDRTLNGFAEENEISKLYVSRIKNGIYQIDHNGGEKVTQIADQYFYRIAYAIGLMAHMPHRFQWHTRNFEHIQKVCKRAQNECMRVLLDGPTGHGKTNALEYYKIKANKVVYQKVTRSMTEIDLLRALCKKLWLGEAIRGSRRMLEAIHTRLTGEPGYLLIIDEQEYARLGLYHTIKEIADFTEHKCGFILSGCGITKIIERHASAQRMGWPQLRRRFFPNRVALPDAIDNREKRKICEDAGVTDKTAQNVIITYCNDFDILSQVIIDAIAFKKQNNREMTGEEMMIRFRESFA